MSKLVQMKHIAVLVSVFAVVPLCAMERKIENKISTKDLRQATKNLVIEKKRIEALAAREKELMKKRRTSTDLAHANAQKEPIKRKRTQYEFLIYPQDILLAVEGPFPENVIRKSNTFMVPKGMDSRWIHKTLIPERIPDFIGQ